ncbi:MAG: nuclear transport factor 2 family protein [Gemmatimonadaceae bacterium]
MSRRLTYAAAASLLAFASAETAAGQVVASPPDPIVEQYRRIATAKFVGRDTVPLARAAAPSYMVVTPNGRQETRGQAIRGIQNFRIDSIALSEVTVQRTAGTAVLLAHLTLHGELHADLPDGRQARASLTGPYRALAVFTLVESDWRLVAESVTPVRPPGSPHSMRPGAPPN